MKLKQNFLNDFNCIFVINNEEFLDQQLQIYYYIDSKNKYFYKINSTNIFIQNFFGSKYIEGVKGFNQHIISNNNYQLIYKEKLSQLEVITWNNSLFIHGILKNN